MANPKQARTDRVPAPAPAEAADDLPHALTFFLTEGERRAVLSALRRVGGTRAQALLAVLGIKTKA